MFDDIDSVSVRQRRGVRRIRIKVVPPGRVEVVAPLRFDQRQLPAILEQHREWLNETLERVRGESLRRATIPPPTHIALHALEHRWLVEYVEGTGQRGQCRKHEDRLRVTLGDNADWRTPIRQWLMRQARATLVPWLEEVSDEIGMPFNKVAIRGQKTRWGSCSAQHNINLNYSLLFLEPDLVRYLFVHELCHTIHLNHSPRFWALVADWQPNHRIYDKALRKGQQMLPEWVQTL